jgi:hypothetical protein
MNFEFTEQQIGYVLQTLAQRPWGESNELITSIQRQAQQAQQAQQARQLQAVDTRPAVLHDADRPINGDRPINARPAA